MQPFAVNNLPELRLKHTDQLKVSFAVVIIIVLTLIVLMWRIG